MSKISELSDGGSLQSTDYLIAVRSGGNVKVRPNGAVSGTTGTFSDDLNVGSGKFFVDVSAGSVGIGTTSFSANSLLTVAGSTDGKLGIGGPANAGATGEGVGLSAYNAIHSANQPFYLRASQTVFRNSSGEVARLDASGNLLVGTDAINAGLDSVAQFEVSEGTAGGIVINTATAGASNYCRLMFSVGNATGNEGLIRYNTSDYHMSFWTEAVERMRLDGSGNLLVGTTTPSGPTTGFAVLGPGYTSAPRALIAHPSGTASGNNYAQFLYAGSAIGSISQLGTTGVLYNTSSDARLKKNIADAEDASSLVDAIKVRQFDWKAHGSHQRYGMVAQELLEVAPEAVSQPEDPEAMMGVDYSKLVPMLVKEIQSLRARVAQLEGA